MLDADLSGIAAGFREARDVRSASMRCMLRTIEQSPFSL
jgi:hypothetical protein